MNIPVINLHLSNAKFNTKNFTIRHCQMVSWLVNNFQKIKSGEITYQDYLSFGGSLGITTFVEECFNAYKEQEYAY